MKWVCHSLWVGLLFGMVAGCSKPEADRSAPSGESPQREEPPPPEPAKLALNLQLGQRLSNQLEWFQQLETFFPGVPEPLKTELAVTQAYSLTVTKQLDQDHRELRLELGGLRMATQLRGRPWFQYDSTGTNAHDPSNPVSASLGLVPGHAFDLVLNAKGEVESIPGLPEFLAEIKKGAPPQARPLLEGLFGEKSLKQLVELSRGLPETPVSRQDSWPIKTQFSLGALGEISLDATNTFTRWEQRQGRLCALLTSVGDFVGARGPLGSATSIGEGGSKGQIWVDPKAGVLVESDVNQKMLQLMTPGGASEGQEAITNRVEQRIHLRLVEVGKRP